MSDAKNPNEPSMEEILASIRRIISEDAGSGSSAASREEAFGDDVLDLTERLDEPAAPAANGSGRFADFTDDFDDLAPQSGGHSDFDQNDDDNLLSPHSAMATIDAFSELQRKVTAEPAERDDAEAASGSGLTVEALVRQAVKPALRQWLDDNLPRMVESMVREEIQRLTDTQRRR